MYLNKNYKYLSVYYCVLIFLIFGCTKKSPGSSFPPANTCIYNGVDTCGKKLSINVNLANSHQTIHSFGASDAWSSKFVGNWNDIAKKNQIADYLFSMDTSSSGNPKGIGLSLWRFNIGAGSFEEGDSSGIPDEYRREECFQKPDGTYDWNKQKGQQWFLNAAKQRDVKYLLGFVVSPPVQMTINGKAYGMGTPQFSLIPSKFNDFADFLAQVCKHFQSTNTPFDYISPVNEPQWNWGSSPSQEGTGASNTDISNLVKILAPDLQKNGVSTKIVVGEAAQVNFLSAAYGTNQGNQISDWFNTASPDFIGNVPNLENTISYHSYFTTCPDDKLIQTRQDADASRKATNPALQLWMTEFGVLGDICGNLNGYPRNTNIDYGLYVAKVIHHDLVVANVSSWQWWLGISPYDYSDGLVYISAPTGVIDPQLSKTDGLVSDSKQLWCLGNFSRFIRPGMKRVDANINNQTDPAYAAGTIMVSAYTDAVSKTLVIVLINEQASAANLTFSGLGAGMQITGGNFSAYTTAADKSLQRSTMAADNIQLEAKSVTTLVAKYN